MDFDLNTPEQLLYPIPLVFEPSLSHKQTFIILHGRGSAGIKFALPFLATMASTTKQTIQSAFPHAKIVFPTAPLRHASWYKPSYVNQWFDMWNLKQHTEHQDLQIEGLKASAIYIHELLRREIKIIGSENVVLWGMSQGCAVSLTSLLSWDGKPFGAIVGMCGWLPFGTMFEAIARNLPGSPIVHSGEKDDKVLIRAERMEETESPEKQAVTYLREKLGLILETGETFRKVPIFLGHGAQDHVVALHLGRQASRCLGLVGADVKFVQYEDVDHWYSEDMLRDIIAFLGKHLNNGKDRDEGL